MCTCITKSVGLYTLLTALTVVSGFINDPLDSTTLRTTTTTTTTPRPTTRSPLGPSNPGEIPAEVQAQLKQMQDSLEELSKQNSALKLQVTSLENDVSTLIQLQERVRHLEEANLQTKQQLTAIQSSGSLQTRVEALESSQPQIKSDISNLKLQLGTSSRAFNSAMQGIQTKLNGVKQTVDQLVAGSVTTASPGGHVITPSSGTVTTSSLAPAHTTPLTTILHDCLDIYSEVQSPGVYTIQPPQSPHPFPVYCDQGWTVIQRRIEGRIPFSSPYRKWADFLNGFGNVSGDYWLGNEKVFNILAQNSYKLRVEGVGYSGKLYWAEYEEFNIENERNDYRIHVSEYTGNYDDTMETANGNKFVTQDHPGDVSFFRDCSGYIAGGWWANTTTSVQNCGYDLNAMHTDTSGFCMSFAGICVNTSIMKISPTSSVTIIGR
ncbi:angiopoietin-related protein 7-like [Saccostrea echinata]|uniref:angiopoietin-related protein 7-like n=1 Tax=Saccostrea echinata TaxID=191078 RepID=UPI002A7EA90C|nr:angiopoietin-related protein 7-like [Saccostrea echinata]